MKLFKRDYNKPGPGVPKNAPKKKGFARFVEILGRDMGNLVKLNLLYFVCLLPAVVLLYLAILAMAERFAYPETTSGLPFLLFALLALVASIPIGPAQTAMNHIVTKMLRDEPGFIWHDFKRLFKENFKGTVLPGIVYALIVGSQVFAVFYYLAMQTQVNFIMIVLYLFSVLLFAMAAPYFFTQASYLTLNAGGMLKNSLLLALGFAPRSLMGALLGTGLIVVQVLFFPFTLPVLVFVGLSIPCLLNMMWIWPPIDKTFNIDKTLRKRNSDELDERIDELEGRKTAAYDEDEEDEEEDEDGEPGEAEDDESEDDED